MLNVVMMPVFAEYCDACRYAECHYDTSHYADYYYAKRNYPCVLIPCEKVFSVIKPGVVMLSVAAPSVIFINQSRYVKKLVLEVGVNPTKPFELKVYSFSRLVRFFQYLEMV